MEKQVQKQVRPEHKHKSTKAFAQVLLKQGLQKIEQAVRLLAQEKALPRLDPFTLKLELGIENPNLQQKRLNQCLDDLQKQLYAQMPTQLRDGTVFCFDSQQAIACPDSQMIFRRYHALGRPIWESFLSVCQEFGLDSRGLFDQRRPKAIAVVLDDDLINENLVEAFSKYMPYRILGQISVGFINEQFQTVVHEAMPSKTSATDISQGSLVRELKSCLVFSIQIIKISPDHHPIKFKVNLLGITFEELLNHLSSAHDRSKHESVRKLVQKTQRDLVKLAQRLDTLAHHKPNPTDLALSDPNTFNATLKDEVLKFLLSLKNDLLHIIEPQTYRTLHALERHEEISRPTPLAVQDAIHAGIDRLFFDQQQNSIVVIGPKRRAHIFNMQGKHITSFRLDPHELSNKQKQNRWMILEGSQIEDFKKKIKEIHHSQ